MRKNDLKSGMKLTLRDGRKFLCVKDICYDDFFGFIDLDENDTGYVTSRHFKNDLTAFNPSNDIVKIEQLSSQDLDKFIKHLKSLFYKDPIFLKWEQIWKEAKNDENL